MSQLDLIDMGPRQISELDQFHTRGDLARAIVERFGHALRRRHVLEPSYGKGAFVRALLGVASRLTCIEIDPQWDEHLRSELGIIAHPAIISTPIDVVCGDYLKLPPLSPMPDVALTNPPYGNRVHKTSQADIDHLEKMLQTVGEFVALLKIDALATYARWSRIWRHGVILQQDVIVPRPHYLTEQSGRSDQNHESVVVHFKRRDLLQFGDVVRPPGHLVWRHHR